MECALYCGGSVTKLSIPAIASHPSNFIELGWKYKMIGSSLLHTGYTASSACTSLIMTFNRCILKFWPCISTRVRAAGASYIVCISFSMTRASSDENVICLQLLLFAAWILCRFCCHHWLFTPCCNSCYLGGSVSNLLLVQR